MNDSLSPTPRTEVQYASDNILPEHFRAIALCATSIKVCSPYVTDPEVLIQSKAHKRILVTDFKSINFISGASSLATLKCLSEAGVSIYHCSMAHAKVIILNENRFAIGSQNLTHKGKTNIEANVISGSDTSPKKVIHFFNNLLEGSIPISIEDINKMEELVSPLKSTFAKLTEKAEDIDTNFPATPHLEQPAEADIKNIIKMPDRNSIRASIEAKSNSKSSILEAHVQVINNGSNYRWSLCPITKNSSFLDLFKEVQDSPLELYRYPIIDINTGRIGFARLANHRITFIAYGVELSKLRLGKSREFYVDIDFEDDDLKLSRRNGYIKISTRNIFTERNETLAIVDFLYTVSGVSLTNFHRNETATLDPDLHTYLPEYDEIREDLEQILIEHILRPFKFRRNLIGKEADSFFGTNPNKNWKIQAHRIGKHTILSAE